LQEARGGSSRIIEAMLARQNDLAHLLTDDATQQEVATEQEAATEVELSSKGAIPEVEEGLTTKVGETASEQAFGDKPTAQTGQIDGGMFEPEEYKAACQAAGTPDKWDDKYWHGHTSAKQWTQPYEGRYDMTFELKKEQSASQAVRDFLAGPTIANYRVIGVAMEMDELRDEFGDKEFDRMFGSSDTLTDAVVGPAQRLKINAGMYTIPFADQMRAMADERNTADKKSSEPEEPVVEAGLEEKPTEAVSTQPAPEMIADELGMRRDQEHA
jgi:hypothetical protein